MCWPVLLSVLTISASRLEKGKRKGVGRCGIAASGAQVRDQINLNVWGGAQGDSLEGRERFNRIWPVKVKINDFYNKTYY